MSSQTTRYKELVILTSAGSINALDSSAFEPLCAMCRGANFMYYWTAVGSIHDSLQTCGSDE